MIEDGKFFAESLLIPHSYKGIFKTIHSTLNQPNYPVICNTYHDKLENSFRNDVPVIRDFSEYESSDFLRNVIFLKQAHNFGQLASKAIIEVKPLLLYYAENQLFAFFIYSIFHFNHPSIGHGLSMNGSTYDNIGIKIKKSGFFQRIINTYTILGSSWIFSPCQRTSSNGIEVLDGDYTFTKEPTISLKKLIQIKNNSKPNPDGYVFDQLDFLFLFLASSLARYKPDMWHSIVSGEHGGEIAYFKQTFTRFESLWNRLIHTLYSLYHGIDRAPLYAFDIETKEYDYMID